MTDLEKRRENAVAKWGPEMVERRFVIQKAGPNPNDPRVGAEGYEVQVNHEPVEFRFRKGVVTAMTRHVAEIMEGRGEGVIVTERPTAKAGS